ncbi:MULTISPECIES: hypothetical protein [Aliivibrio]|nr:MULTISPECIES: hypothetical protein [Aliivibrio]MDD9180784.1 hypothetical protein [Aliivibrio sp. A6]
MQTKMRHNQRTLKRKIASETPELREIRANLPNLMKGKPKGNKEEIYAY